MIQTQTFDYFDNTGGMNAISSEAQLEDNEMSYLLNVVLSPSGSLKKRTGIIKVGDKLSDYPILGLDKYKTVTDSTLLAFTEKKAFYYDGNNVIIEDQLKVKTMNKTTGVITFSDDLEETPVIGQYITVSGSSDDGRYIITAVGTATVTIAAASIVTGYTRSAGAVHAHAAIHTHDIPIVFLNLAVGFASFQASTYDSTDDTIDMNVDGTHPFVEDDYLELTIGSDTFTLQMVAEISSTRITVSGAYEDFEDTLSPAGTEVVYGTRQGVAGAYDWDGDGVDEDLWQYPTTTTANIDDEDVLSIQEYDRWWRCVVTDTTEVSLDEQLRIEHGVALAVKGRWTQLTSTASTAPKSSIFDTESTVADLSDIHTVSLNDNLYTFNGLDESFRYDGTKMFRAGFHAVPSIIEHPRAIPYFSNLSSAEGKKWRWKYTYQYTDSNGRIYESGASYQSSQITVGEDMASNAVTAANPTAARRFTLTTAFTTIYPGDQLTITGSENGHNGTYTVRKVDETNKYVYVLESCTDAAGDGNATAAPSTSMIVPIWDIPERTDTASLGYDITNVEANLYRTQDEGSDYFLSQQVSLSRIGNYQVGDITYTAMNQDVLEAVVLSAPSSGIVTATFPTDSPETYYIQPGGFITITGSVGLEDTVGDGCVYSAANPSVITTSKAHGLTTGNFILVSGHLGVADVDGIHEIIVITPTTFSIPVDATGGGGGCQVNHAGNNGTYMVLTADNTADTLTYLNVNAVAETLVSADMTNELMKIECLNDPDISGLEVGDYVHLKNTNNERNDGVFVSCIVDDGDESISVNGVTFSSDNPVNIASAAHGLSTGNYILVTNSDTVGDLADGIYKITKVDAGNFTVPFDGADTGGGTCDIDRVGDEIYVSNPYAVDAAVSNGKSQGNAAICILDNSTDALISINAELFTNNNIEENNDQIPIASYCTVFDNRLWAGNGRTYQYAIWQNLVLGEVTDGDLVYIYDGTTTEIYEFDSGDSLATTNAIKVDISVATDEVDVAVALAEAINSKNDGICWAHWEAIYRTGAVLLRERERTGTTIQIKVKIAAGGNNSNYKINDDTLSSSDDDTYKNFIITRKQSRIWFSKEGEPEAFVGTFDDVQGGFYLDIAPNDGQAITGVIPLKNNLIVFKEDSCYRIYHAGGDNYSFERISPNIGCIAPKTICAVENKLMFLSRNGAYATDGFYVEYIGKKMENQFQNIDQDIISSACAVNHIADKEYRITLPYSESGESLTTNTHSFCHNYSKEFWSLFDTTVYTFYAKLNNNTYLGKETGEVFQIRRFDSAFDFRDDFDAISAEIRTKWYDLNAPSSRKFFYKFVTHVYQPDFASDTVIGYSYDFADGFDTLGTFSVNISPWGRFAWGRSLWGYQKSIPVRYSPSPKKANYGRFQFSNENKDETLEILGWSIEAKMLSPQAIRQE